MKKRIKNKQLSDASVPVGLKKKLKERERENNELCLVFTQTFSVTREITREEERYL